MTDGKTTAHSPSISSAPFAKQDFFSWRDNSGVNAPQCRNTATLLSKMMFEQTPRWSQAQLWGSYVSGSFLARKGNTQLCLSRAELAAIVLKQKGANSAQPTAQRKREHRTHKAWKQERQVTCALQTDSEVDLALGKGGELGTLKTPLFSRAEHRVQSAPDCAATRAGIPLGGWDRNPAWAAPAALAPLPAAKLRSGNHGVKFHMQIQPQNRGWRAATWQPLLFDQSHSSNLIIQSLAWAFKQLHYRVRDSEKFQT